MMRFLDEKAGKTSVQLEALINKDELALNNFYVKFCDYKKYHIIIMKNRQCVLKQTVGF